MTKGATRRTSVAALAVIAMLAAACGGETSTTTSGEVVATTDPGGGATTSTAARQNTTTTNDATGEGCQPVTLQFSTPAPPANVDAQAAHKASEVLAEKTDGQFVLEVFDSASLFDQTSEYPALESGDLAMAYETSHFIADRVPAATILTIPYLIHSVDHLYAVIQSEVGQDIFAAALEEAGVRPLTAIANGQRNLMLTDAVDQVNTPEDMAGVRLRMANAPAWIMMGESLGANPTPIAFNEVYLALETGAIDAQDNALSTAVNARFHEVSDQVALTGHFYNSIWPAINEEIYQSLCPEFQQALQEAWIEARDFGTEINDEQEAAAITTLQEAGLSVYEPDVEAFREHVLAFYLENPDITSTFVEGHLDTIEELAP